LNFQQGQRIFSQLLPFQPNFAEETKYANCKDLNLYSYSSSQKWYVSLFLIPEELLQVAKEVDYLILTAPSTPETVKIIGTRVLTSMKSTAFLINIARGELIQTH
jgi:lactate dehydrogenase-like 2-hydroxyacid dehydrogenase